ncbi:hypothetical protein [Reichenbachiella versicolor]|uniref:hypothetical protein n=1 Tax=Reichenbachiella versicolor TaxID=1821036 RepID=UPI000D6E42D8|nr:hypothetical protein [Reichenbachiella versicolor]
MKKPVIILSLFYLLASCADESFDDIQNTSDVANSIDNDTPYSVEEGLMNFSSLETLDEYLFGIEQQLIAIENESQSNARTIQQVDLPEGFVPLVDSYHNKSSSDNSRILEGSESDEAIAIEIAEVINENLIPNEALHYVLDTARRLKIANDIYHVTEGGTFIYSPNYTNEFENLYENFLDEYLNYSEQIDSITYRYNNVLFKDSFGYVARKDLSEEKVIDFISGNYETFDQGEVIEEGPSNARTNGGNTVVYGLRTVSKPKTNKIGILNVRSAMFDSDHRVAVSLDEVDINIGFAGANYANFKVKFQTKKTVRTCVKIFRKRRCKNLYSYWVKRTASDLVIGQEEMELEFTYPFGWEGGNYYDVYDRYPHIAGDAIYTLSYNGLKKIDFISGWSGYIRLFRFEVNLKSGGRANEFLWNQGKDWVKGEIKKGTTKFVKTHTNYDADAAKMVAIQYGRKEYFISDGIGRHRNKQEQKANFLTLGGGFAIKKNNDGNIEMGKYRNVKAKLKSGSIFGAIKYNGKWRGVRIGI